MQLSHYAEKAYGKIQIREQKRVIESIEMSRGSGSGGSSRGKSNSRRHSMIKSSKNQRSNSMNPNNKSNQSSRDNRSNQMHPNNPKSSRDNRSNQMNPNNPKSSGRWSQRMDAKSASRIQSHKSAQDLIDQARSAAEKK